MNEKRLYPNLAHVNCYIYNIFSSNINSRQLSRSHRYSSHQHNRDVVYDEVKIEMSNDFKRPMSRPNTPTTSMGQNNSHFPSYSVWSSSQPTGYAMPPSRRVNGYDVVDLENQLASECQVTSSSSQQQNLHNQEQLLANYGKRRPRKREMATMDVTMATTSVVLDQNLLNGRPPTRDYPTDQWSFQLPQTRVSGLPATSTMPVVSPQPRHMAAQVSLFLLFLDLSIYI